MNGRAALLKTLRSVATIGIAFCGPIALLSGIFVALTVLGGTPRFLTIVFVFALSATALSTVLYLAVDLQERGGNVDQG